MMIIIDCFLFFFFDAADLSGVLCTSLRSIAKYTIASSTEIKTAPATPAGCCSDYDYSLSDEFLENTTTKFFITSLVRYFFQIYNSCSLEPFLFLFPSNKLIGVL